MTTVLTEAWSKILPGTRDEFCRFMGVRPRKLSVMTWDVLSELMWERFGMSSLGGGQRFVGTEMEEKMFRFGMPKQHRWWRTGVPAGGARIDRASEGMRCVQGWGSTLDVAAMSAALVLWELTWRRAKGLG